MGNAIRFTVSLAAAAGIAVAVTLAVSEPADPTAELIERMVEITEDTGAIVEDLNGVLDEMDERHQRRLERRQDFMAEVYNEA